MIVALGGREFPILCPPHFVKKFFGCTGSSLLHTGFLQLQKAEVTLVAVRELLLAVASVTAEHRL